MAKKSGKVLERQVKTKRKTSKCSQSDRATKLLQQQQLKYNIKESFVKLERIDDAGTSINPESNRNAQNPNIPQTLDHNLGEMPVKLETVEDGVVYVPAHATYNQTESNTNEFDLVSTIEIVKNETNAEVDDATLSAFRKDIEQISHETTKAVDQIRNTGTKRNQLNSHKCDFCPKVFTKLLWKVNHTRCCGRKYECHLCNERCSSFKQLRTVHMRSHIGQFDCNYCTRKFYSAKGYKNHVLGKHLHLFKFQCRICHKIIEKISDIRKHKESCKKPTRQSQIAKYFECSLCGSELPRIRDLRKHVLLEECTNQRIKIKRRKPRSQSMKRAAGNPFPCLYCNRSFSQKNGIYEHIKKNHPTKPSYLCPLCRSRIYKPDEIDDHKFKCRKRRSLECIFCKFTTKKNNVSELKIHMRIAHTIPERVFKCNICTKDYTTRSNLDQHIRAQHRISTSERKYECYLCKESCISMKVLRENHMRTHFGTYDCKYCSNRYTHRISYNTHIRENHYHLFEFQCQECQGIIKDYKCVRKHERSCMNSIGQSKGVIYFKCSLCGLGLPRVADLKEHVLFGKCTKYKEKLKKLRKEKRLKIIQLRKEPQRIQLKPLEFMIDGQIKLKCPLCEYTRSYRDKYSFKAHFWKHTGEHPYHCPYCERSFKCIGSVSRHIKANHPTKPVFKCQLCRQTIYKPDEVNEHEFRCVKRRSLECVFCKLKKKWNALYSLKEHIKTVHINEEAFKCRICKKSFTTKGGLNGHMLHIHLISSSTRTYECYLCKEIFLSGKFLRRNHMKTHTIEMPSRIELEPLEIVINGKKLFKCPLCEFKRPARNLSEFKWHSEKHTGQKLHHCLYCERSFKHNNRVVAHTQLVHPTKPTLKCALCRMTFYKPDDINEHEFRCKKRRSFECIFCKCKFDGQKLNLLKEHIRSFHTGERPFECGICTLTYRTKNCLSRHMRRKHF